MNKGAVFRVDEPITERGYCIHDYVPPGAFPLYGVIDLARYADGLSHSWMYFYSVFHEKWVSMGWNWKPEHIEQFTEIQID